MNKKSFIWVKIEVNKYYNLLIKLNNIGVNIYEIKKYQDYILIKTNIEDYKKIKKYLISYKVSIYSKTGLDKFKDVLKKYQVFTLGIILGIILLFIANSMIFKVEIKTHNKKIEELLITELKNNGLATLRLKKDHKEIEVIVKKILDNNKDVIEWLEIEYDGLVMIVNVTEKINKEIVTEHDNCNIISSKDAKISSLNIYRGIALKEINDYVLKGEVILSGSIIHNEEVKNTVCASGEVYGEVWYKVKVEVPFIETYREYTGKNRYNFNVKVNDDIYQILNSRVKVKEEEVTNLYTLNDFEINLVKEKEYVEKTKTLSEEEAYDKGLNLAIEKVLLMLNEDEEILLKKVLKKDVFDSTIYLEIFIVTKESIGKLQVVEGGINDGIEPNP